jgi:hypothetical protein
MKYRKRPVIVDAVQFRRDHFSDIQKFTDGKATNFRIERCPNGKAYCDISTLEGVMTATERDFIIKGVKGEFYPCKEDVFLQTYEPVIQGTPKDLLHYPAGMED